MQNNIMVPNAMLDTRVRLQSVMPAIALMLLFMLSMFSFLLITVQQGQGQNYRVIYTFTGGRDGGRPSFGLTRDSAGNFYSTTLVGGTAAGWPCGPGCGTVFKLVHAESKWVLTTIHIFTGNRDGAFPGSGVIFGPDGKLYGVTGQGGQGGFGEGTVYSLSPPATPCKTALCPWTENVIHRFARPGGISPWGSLIFDEIGNLYGTTAFGGAGDWGTVYELTPSDHGWVERILYAFTGGNDGGLPYGGVVFDQNGNLYGTTGYGGEFDGCWGEHCGTVFQLLRSESGWTERVLYNFRGTDDGMVPLGGLLIDLSGNLYGGTIASGTGGGGTVYMLSLSDGEWTFTTLYSLTGYNSGPTDSLVMDDAGNLYGTTAGDGVYGHGNVFKLTRSNGGWTYTSLYDFTGESDGGQPEGRVLLAPNGKIYGTASAGGIGGRTCNPNWTGCGVIFEITP